MDLRAVPFTHIAFLWSLRVSTPHGLIGGGRIYPLRTAESILGKSIMIFGFPRSCSTYGALSCLSPMLKLQHSLDLHTRNMPRSKSPRVRFMNSIVQSISRTPTQRESFNINVLECHHELCSTCRRLDLERSTATCRSLAIIERVVLRSFILGRDGHAYSLSDEAQCLVRVEIPRNNLAVRSLLFRVRSARRCG
jgi:hypothetical protein